MSLATACRSLHAAWYEKRWRGVVAAPERDTPRPAANDRPGFLPERDGGAGFGWRRMNTPIARAPNRRSPPSTVDVTARIFLNLIGSRSSTLLAHIAALRISCGVTIDVLTMYPDILLTMFPVAQATDRMRSRCRAAR